MNAPNYFVGLPVALADPRGMHLDDAPRCVRLFHPDDLHVTVAFLGRVDDGRARTAFASGAAHDPKATAAALGRIVALGDRRRPSALSALVRCDEPTLRSLRDGRDAMLREAGARPDDRPFLAHLTVGRIARSANDDDRRAAIAWAASRTLGDAPVRLERIALYTWSLDRSLRLFRILDERALRADE